MQGPLSSFGEAIGDAIDSVKAVTSNVADNVGREIAKNDILRKVGDGVADVAESIKEGAADLSERVGNEWEKATAKLDDRGRPVLSDPKSRDDEDNEKGSRRMLGSMPPGCFCDMRGYACPMHRGREAWRFTKDFQLHVEQNVDPEHAGARATGIAGDADVSAGKPGEQRSPGSSSASTSPSSRTPRVADDGGLVFGGPSREEIEKKDAAFATLVSTRMRANEWHMPCKASLRASVPLWSPFGCCSCCSRAC